MSTYEQDLKKLGKLCAKCGGQCCEPNVSISKEECLELKNKFKDFKCGIRKSSYGQIHTMKSNSKKVCFFIKKPEGKHLNAGCMMKLEDRPLSCKLFPLTFLVENNKEVFYMSDLCPYGKEAIKLKSWIKESVKDAKKDLKSWKKSEKLTRSSIHRRIHKGHKHLIALK